MAGAGGWFNNNMNRQKSDMEMNTESPQYPEYESMSVSVPQQSASQNALQKGGETAAMSGGNPWAAGAGFLLGYLQGKQQEFEAKKAEQLASSQQMTQGQQAALTNMMNAYRSALL